MYVNGRKNQRGWYRHSIWLFLPYTFIYGSPQMPAAADAEPLRRQEPGIAVDALAECEQEVGVRSTQDLNLPTKAQS